MRVTNALDEFHSFVRRRGYTLEMLTPALAIELMTDFYADVRADECDLADQGDMLLFQWATVDWGNGEHFEYEIARQLIFPDEDDDSDEEFPADPCIWQLRLTLRYIPTPALRGVGSGNRWCESPAALSDLLQFIARCPATVAAAADAPFEVEAVYGDVE